MLKPIADFIVKIADLAEAEGRTLREVVAKMGIAVGLFAIAAILALGGAVMLLIAMFIVLEREMGPAGAAAIVGFLGVLIAGGLLWMGRKYTR